MKIILNKKEQHLLNELPYSVEFRLTKTDNRGVLRKITGKNLGKNNGFTDMKISLVGIHKNNSLLERHIFFCSKEVEKALKSLITELRSLQAD
jgi:hypothetical protein